MQPQIPERRDVWFKQSRTACVCFNRSKHCGRMRSKVGSRNEAVRSDCARISKRIGISPAVRRDLQLLTVEEFGSLEAKILEIQRMLGSLSQRVGAAVLARS